MNQPPSDSRAIRDDSLLSGHWVANLLLLVLIVIAVYAYLWPQNGARPQCYLSHGIWSEDGNYQRDMTLDEYQFYCSEHDDGG